MDGTLGLVWLLTSLTDMTLNDCPNGCLKTEKLEPQIFYQLGQLQSDEFQSANEFYFGYDSHRRRGPSRPTYGLSLTTDGAAWFGIGGKWSSQYVYDSPWFIETSLMPGFYRQGDGADLDGVLQFRAALGIGYTFDNGSNLTVVYDSMSNADFFDDSPSRETACHPLDDQLGGAKPSFKNGLVRATPEKGGLVFRQYRQAHWVAVTNHIGNLYLSCIRWPVTHMVFDRFIQCHLSAGFCHCRKIRE